jgi:alpha-glucosidase
MSGADAAPWWQSAVIYQIYPRSFCLADPAGRRARLGHEAATENAVRDGAGDLEGIRRHLDYLAELGVDAIWLSPFQPSPMADLGYDVSDYCGVDPLFGTMEDFDRLLAEAHERSLRVILDWVPNHTSDQHPWFQEARSSRSSPRRDWYLWRDGRGGDPSQPPNNWKRAFGEGPAWTFDEASGQWYLHLFLPEQPDLNWANPEVREVMADVVRFWLDRGVDGFRIDVTHALGKDPALPDAPDDLAALPYCVLNDEPSTHPILRDLRKLIDSYPQQAVAVGEVFLLSTEQIATYYGDGDELHLAFNFPPMGCGFEAACFRDRIVEAEELLNPRGAWPSWVLSNHDARRHRTRFGGSERRARAAAVMLLGWRGTPFVYAGEELGLEDAVVPPERVVDPGGRDGCRAPIPWDASGDHGWELDGHDGWLPWPPEPDGRNATTLEADPSSILHLYRRLLAARRASPALSLGDLELLDAPDGVLAFRRTLGDDIRVVAINFTEVVRPLPFAELGARLGDRWTVEVGSGGPGALATAAGAFAGSLGPEEAVFISPA